MNQVGGQVSASDRREPEVGERDMPSAEGLWEGLWEGRSSNMGVLLERVYAKLDSIEFIAWTLETLYKLMEIS